LINCKRTQNRGDYTLYHLILQPNRIIAIAVGLDQRGAVAVEEARAVGAGIGAVAGAAAVDIAGAQELGRLAAADLGQPDQAVTRVARDHPV
jgi:hypothetical protein